MPVLTISTPYLFKTLAMAVSRQALVQHAIFTTLSAHPSLGSAAGWWFEIVHTLDFPILLVPVFQPISAAFRTHPPHLLPRLCYQAQMRFAILKNHLIFIGDHEIPTLRALMPSFVSKTKFKTCSTLDLRLMDRQPMALKRFANAWITREMSIGTSF